MKIREKAFTNGDGYLIRFRYVIPDAPHREFGVRVKLGRTYGLLELQAWFIDLSVDLCYWPFGRDLRALGSKIAAAAKSAARWLVAPYERPRRSDRSLGGRPTTWLALVGSLGVELVRETARNVARIFARAK